MAKASHQGSDIAYQVIGEGTTVVLQHGLFGNRQTWVDEGYVDVLQSSYQLVLVDSLGHGESSKPAGASRYSVENRAGDIIAVLDALNVDKAHYIGYSMGGWIGTGVARFHADRLHSLVIGGWDCKNGAAVAIEQMGVIDFATMIEAAKGLGEELAAGIEAGNPAAFEACWDALAEIEGATDAIANVNVPTLFWCGRDDHYFPEVETLSKMLNIDLLATDGDHVGAMTTHADQAAQGLMEFLNSR